MCLHGKGLHEEAERHYKMALLAAEDNPEPHFNLGLLYAIPASVKYVSVAMHMHGIPLRDGAQRTMKQIAGMLLSFRYRWNPPTRNASTTVG